MRSDTLFDTLQNLMNFRPSQSQIADILGVRQSVIGSRASRNSNYTDEEIALIETHYAIKILGTSDPEIIELNYYPDVNGSCGFGLPVIAENIEKIKTTKSLINDYSENKQYSVINAYGVSMQPYIQDLDRLIVEHWQGQQILDNRIYVFRYKDELFVKRLAKNIDEVIISSDNPEFGKKIIKADDLQIIGQIVGLIRNTK